MDTVPLVLFSGGLDSSYSVYAAMKEENVHALYIDGCQGPGKIRAELTARRNIQDLIERKTDRQITRNYVVGPNSFFGDITGYSRAGIADAMFSQAHKWLFGALEVSDGRLHKYITISYINGDQISAKITDITAAWTHLQSFVKSSPIGIYTPLLWVKKIDIIEELLRDFPALLGSIWVCETPVSKPGTTQQYANNIREVQSNLTVEMEHTHCGCCDACTTLAKTLMSWELKHQRSFSHALESVLPKPAFTDAYKVLDMTKDALALVTHSPPRDYNQQLQLDLERTDLGTIDKEPSDDSSPTL